MFESVELASQSEIQHLTSKLERANDTICANELEVERLNMEVNNLTAINQKLLGEHRNIQDELNLSKNSREVSERIAWKCSNVWLVRNGSGPATC